MIRCSALHADRIIAVSYHTGSDIQKHYDILEEKISVIYHGIKNISDRHEPIKNAIVQSILSQNNPYILYVGTIEPRKNLERLVVAFTKIIKQGVNHRLVLAGRSGWKNKGLYELIKRYHLDERVVFTGYIDDNSLAELYRRADVFSYVPLYEGFGMPVSEAMSFGLPIITSNTSSLPEVVGDTALQVNPYHVDEIAEGLLSLIRNEDLRKRLGEAAKERSAIFQWDRSAREHLNVFLQVINGENTKPS
jgi:glycosyltransferase involved in cell wall biosynthesis